MHSIYDRMKEIDLACSRLMITDRAVVVYLEVTTRYRATPPGWRVVTSK